MLAGGGDNALDNLMLSTVVAVASRAEAAFLEEAVFSLAIQDWLETEVLVVLREEESASTGALKDIVEGQPWPPKSVQKILTITVPPRSDARSVLFNHGARRARGRFIAFLDAGSVVYQHGYAALVRRLLETESAVAVGHCRTAFVREESGQRFVLTKDYPARDAAPDLNHLAPTCACVIDRTRVRLSNIRFDERRSPREDAGLLPRLCAERGADFSEFGVSVCERRLRLAGVGRVRFAARARLWLFFERYPRLKAGIRVLIRR